MYPMSDKTDQQVQILPRCLTKWKSVMPLTGSKRNSRLSQIAYLLVTVLAVKKIGFAVSVSRCFNFGLSPLCLVVVAVCRRAGEIQLPNYKSDEPKLHFLPYSSCLPILTVEVSKCPLYSTTVYRFSVYCFLNARLMIMMSASNWTSTCYHRSPHRRWLSIVDNTKNGCSCCILRLQQQLLKSSPTKRLKSSSERGAPPGWLTCWHSALTHLSCRLIY